MFQLQTVSEQLSAYDDGRNSADKYAIIQDYWNAINTNDEKALITFESFGEDVRQRIMNINEYRHGFAVGFEDFKFGKYNWIEKATFLNVEEVSLKHSKDNNVNYNYIKLGQTPNSCWGYGYNYTCGAAGGAGPLSVFNTFYSSKDECINAALKFFKVKFESAILKNDTGNFKMPYCQQILDMICDKLKPVYDFSVNNKGQIMLF